MNKKRPSALSIRRSIRRKKPDSKVLATRKAVRRAQPIHKRIALHPINGLVLLCIGVLLASFTLNTMALSYTVNASLSAPVLTQPAVITSPSDGDQESVQSITVSGTCPNNSYVNLTDNGVFVGASNCAAGGTFQIGVALSSGTNVLVTQDYNVTNSPGPTSPSISVTYTPPNPPDNNGGGSSSSPSSANTAPSPISQLTSTSSTATPTGLYVTQVDLTIPYISQDLTPIVSFRPTFTGIAVPYSYVVVLVHSNYFTCTTYANAQGYWSCTMPNDLPAATHTVNITAKTPQGKDLTYPPFTIHVISSNPPNAPIPSPYHLTSSYTYTQHLISQPVTYTIHPTGGRAPYAYTVDWGDGKSQTIIRQTGDDFTISHTYGWINALTATRIIKVQGIDAAGQVGTLQLPAALRNPAYHSVIAGITKSGGLWGLFNDVRPWLWILWPGYVIIVLLVFSFWLGEREELIRITSKKRPKLHHSGHH
jgi:hypothetical protein